MLLLRENYQYKLFYNGDNSSITKVLYAAWNDKINLRLYVAKTKKNVYEIIRRIDHGKTTSDRSFFSCVLQNSFIIPPQ